VTSVFICNYKKSLYCSIEVFDLKVVELDMSTLLTLFVHLTT
jgi:hypothetical protein